MTDIATKRVLVNDALQLLAAAALRLQRAQHWTGRAYALDGRGRSVRVDDPRATRFCLVGAVLRAEHERHGTAMPIRTSNDPAIDDLVEPVTPPGAPPRLIVALDILGYASRSALERIGVTFIERDAESGEPYAALTLHHLPEVLGLHPRARHRRCLRTLYMAVATLHAIGSDDQLLDCTIPDSAVEEGTEGT